MQCLSRAFCVSAGGIFRSSRSPANHLSTSQTTTSRTRCDCSPVCVPTTASLFHLLCSSVFFKLFNISWNCWPVSFSRLIIWSMKYKKIFTNDSLFSIIQNKQQILKTEKLDEVSFCLKHDMMNLFVSAWPAVNHITVKPVMLTFSSQVFGNFWGVDL